MSFWTLGANVELMKGGGWPFQSDPSIATELVTFQCGEAMRGEGESLCFQPVDWLVKKAICRKSPILHAYGSSSLFHLDLPLASDISRRERTKQLSVMSW